jgi:hypothetical protein
MLELFLFETIVEKEKDMHPIIKKHIQLTRNVFQPNPKDEKKNTSNNTMNLKKKKGKKIKIKIKMQTYSICVTLPVAP